MSTFLRCPVCDKCFSTTEEGIALPFCSRRCKLIDRARWMDEGYGLPYESVEGPELPVSFPSENDGYEK